MGTWITRFEFHRRREGIRGVFRRVSRRVFGPSKRDILGYINDLSVSQKDRLERLVSQIDMIARFNVAEAAQQSEKRTALQVQDCLNSFQTRILEHLAVTASSIEALRSEVNEYKRSQALVLIDPESHFVLFSDYGFDILVPASERGLLLYFMRKGLKRIEHGVRQTILDNVKTGDAAVDIGANVGLHTILMARLVGSQGRVHAFEPHPIIAEALRQTIILNGLIDHVKVEDKVVTDKDGEIDFWVSDHSPNSSVFAVQQASKCSCRRQTVSLDNYFPSGTRVDFVKMDAEGAEPLIMNGMARILRENPSIRLVLEVSKEHFERSKIGMHEFFEKMVSEGFCVSEIEDSGTLVPIFRADMFAGLVNANILLKRT